MITALTLCALPALAGAMEDPFAALAEESRPLDTRRQVDYSGQLELGAAYVPDDNFMFGQYNGRHEEGAVVIGDLKWQGRNDANYWAVSGTDLGLDTRSAGLRWGKVGKIEIEFGYDGQLQVKNNTGATPYSGSSSLLLPGDWIAANATGGFASLDGSLRSLDRELARDIYRLDITANLTDQWNLDAGLRYEKKEGTSDVGAAFYTNAAAGHAAILPLAIDYDTTEFDVSLNYQGSRLQLTGAWVYSRFDNNDSLLRWQNPYSGFSPDVDFPQGEGGMGLAPDNEQNRLRVLGVYTFTPALRLQVDGSYAVTSQDQGFADYTVNTALPIEEPLSVDSLDAQVATGTLDTRLFYRPLPKLNIELRYHGEQKDYDGDRNGYRYVPGDATGQSSSALTVYNSYHDLSKNLASMEASYRLPRNSKLSLEYAYEQVERENAAVEKTTEDALRLRYRIAPLASLTVSLELLYAERVADTYYWDQSYYALLDARLINSTPDAQRFITHPLVSQYHLASRDRSEGKIDLHWQAGVEWSLGLNLLWRQDDYSETTLGLLDEEFGRVALTGNWAPDTRLNFSAWVSYDQYGAAQTGRNFRGGVEKNPFEIYPPLPQASDPARNWDVDSEDSSISLGLTAAWQLQENIQISADYNYVDTASEYDFATHGAADIGDDPLPDNDTTGHQLEIAGTYTLREDIDIKVSYQFWKYTQRDWALRDSAPGAIDKVLTLGEQEADEDLHYIGASVIYRWQ